MAIDKKLQIFDDEGNPVDYDILASDVKFNDGKDLPTKLDEMEDEIGEGGYTPPAGGIPKTDLAPSVQQTLDDVANKVDKVPGKGLSTNDYTTEEKTKLGNLPTNPVQSITVNGQTQQKDTNGNVNIEVQAGEQVSVIQPTNPDGTFIIRVGSTDYTINLNHTHEDMVKLEKFVESNPPASMTDDTIYVQVNDINTPTEIEALYIFGLEFAGGGGTPGLPAVQSPSDGSTIQLGENQGSGVSQNIVVRAKNLNYGGSTDGLTIEAVGSGLTLSYDQQTGQSSITIPQNNGAVNTEVGVAFSGSGSFNGELRFKQGSTVLAVVEIVVEVAVPVLPTGFTANKAWNDSGDGHAVLEDAPGYCISPVLGITNNHNFEICFGFVRDANNPAMKYGCASDSSATNLNNGTGGTVYSAKTDSQTRTAKMNGNYASCTFLMSELNNCYIKDTDTNTYLWKGNNVT